MTPLDLPPTPAAPARSRWGAVFVVTLGGVIAALHVGKLPPALPHLREELGLSLVAAGFVVSAFSLIGGLLGMLMGNIGDALGRPRLAAVAFGALILGGGLGLFAGGQAAVMLSRLIEGFGFIGLAVALPPVVAAAAAAADRPRAMTIWSTYTPAGMALALVASPLLIARAGWQGLWLAVLLVTVVVAVVVLRLMRGIALPPPPPGRKGAVILETLGHRGLLLSALTFGAYALQWMTVMVFLPSFLAEALAIGPGQAPLWTAAVVLANLPGIALGGWLLRQRLPARWFAPIASLGMALASVVLFTADLPAALRLGAAFGFSVLGGLIPVVLFAASATLAPTAAHLGAASGMLIQGSAIGQIVGPPAVAAAISASGDGWQGALPVLLAAAAIAGLAGWWGLRSPRP